MMQMQGFVVVVAVRCLLFVVGVVSSPSSWRGSKEKKSGREESSLFGFVGDF